MGTIPDADPWAFFDKVYCITLSDRLDRRRQAETAFERVGLAGRVVFVTVERHPEDCEQGIYESHLRCLRLGLRAGAATILVFEDDIVFEGFCAQRLAAAVAFLKANPAWRLFFLGCLVKGSRATPQPAVLKVVYRCLAHAYAVNRAMAAELVKMPWRRVAYDDMLSRFEGGIYALYPAFAFQSDAATDNIRHRRLDRFRRWCGGLRRIQKFNELFYRRRMLLLAVHVVGLAALVWLAVMAST